MPVHLTDAHHLTHVADSGKTVFDNLVLLCPRHHRALHHAHDAGHPWVLTKDPPTGDITATRMTPSGRTESWRSPAVRFAKRPKRPLPRITDDGRVLGPAPGDRPARVTLDGNDLPF